MPNNEDPAAILKKRTLTNLYNERPAWLANAHRAGQRADGHVWTYACAQLDHLSMTTFA